MIAGALMQRREEVAAAYLDASPRSAASGAYRSQLVDIDTALAKVTGLLSELEKGDD